MEDTASNFLILSVLAMATVLLVFGIKYLSAMRLARIGTDDRENYRALAQKSADAQAACAASLAVLEADLAQAKTRLAAIEKVLRDVE